MLPPNRASQQLTQGTVVALPPFGCPEIHHLQLNSQKYLPCGCQVLGGYEKLSIFPYMISSPARQFAVQEHIKII
jgi:hypothetical protein